MELSELDIQDLYAKGQFGYLVEILSTCQDPVARFYFVRCLINLKRYEETFNCLSTFDKVGNFNVTLASLMLKSLVEQNDVEQIDIYWPKLQVRLAEKIQTPQNTVKKDWILENFASCYFVIEERIHPSIHTLKWLLGVFREQLRLSKVTVAEEIVQLILVNYGDSNSSYWTATAEFQINRLLLHDAKKSYQKALEFYDELHPGMYPIFRFLMQFYGVEELKSVFSSKSHLFDDLTSFENLSYRNSMFEIRSYLESDTKGYVAFSVNIQSDLPIVLKGGAPSQSKSILATFDVLGSTRIPTNFSDFLQDKILYRMDDFAHCVFFTDASVPKQQIRNSPFAKDFTYQQTRNNLYQVPVSTLDEITLPNFTHLFIASPGRVGSTLLHKMLRMVGIESISETSLTFTLADHVFRGRLSPNIACLLSKLDSFLLFEENIPPVVVKKLPAHASRGLADILDKNDQVVFLYRNLEGWISSRMRMNSNPRLAIKHLTATLISHSMMLQSEALGGVLWYEDLLNSPFVQLEEIFGDLRRLEWQVPGEDVQGGTPLSRENLRSRVSDYEMSDYLRAWKASPGPSIATELGLTGLEMSAPVRRTFAFSSFNTLKTRVVPANISGNVDHFYHFFLGLFLPFLFSQKDFLLQRQYVFPDLGPMNRHLTWLSEFGVDLEIDFHGEQEAQVDFEISCIGWDHPSAYQLGEFELARDTLLNLMNFSEPDPNLKPRVLIIDRSVTNYDERENKSNGALRRSIPNLHDLFSKLDPIVDVDFVTLEDKNLKEQIELFSAADIVVAQHGASLSNLLWCKPSAWVIEIIDPQKRPPYFEALADRLALNYVSVPQQHVHSEIDIDSLVSIILQKCSDFVAPGR